jgi:hypothetical protein
MKENKEEVQSTSCIYSYACNTYLEKIILEERVTNYKQDYFCIFVTALLKPTIFLIRVFV